MMNIGILSMQKILNYGSFLQALSLKIQLEKRGHNVYFVDILPGRQIVSSQNTSNTSLFVSKLDKYFFKRIENYFLYNKMSKIHINDYETYLETTKVFDIEKMFDLVVVGSDEVFNATIPSKWGFTTQLFGDIKNSKNVVTYAACCGSTTFESAQKYEITDELYNAMRNFKYISVRDKNTFDFVENILNIKPEIHVDPVFISDFDKYIPKIKKRKPFMLVYAYGNRITDEKEIAAIKSYAKKHNLDIISVGMQQRWCKHNIAASAFELLAYVKGAECIVTDTFHGTVFSIKYNKRFAVLIRESNKNKLGGLLDQFQLSSRSVDDINNFEDIISTEVNYDVVNEIIKYGQEKSYSYMDKITKLEV